MPSFRPQPRTSQTIAPGVLYQRQETLTCVVSDPALLWFLFLT